MSEEARRIIDKLEMTEAERDAALDRLAAAEVVVLAAAALMDLPIRMSVPDGSDGPLELISERYLRLSSALSAYNKVTAA